MRCALLALLLVTLAACSTVQGAGSDISKAGDFVSHSARRVQDSM